MNFNHTTEAEKKQFKKEIANRLFQIDVGGNTFEDTLPKMTLFQTDQLLIFYDSKITNKQSIYNLSRYIS